MRLEALPAPAEGKPEPGDAVDREALATSPEPTTTLYARVPWSLGEKLRDLARERSRAEHRRVTVNELVIEAVSKLAS